MSAWIQEAYDPALIRYFRLAEMKKMHPGVSEIRQNKATRQWVICAPSRGKRPRDHKHEDRSVSLPEKDQNCPFCPNNESMLPGILLQMPAGEQGHGWQTRVVQNKFPALSPQGTTERFGSGIYVSMPGYGRHEVLIETPLHNHDIAQMSVEEAGVVIETYHKRYVDLMEEHRNMMTIIFRNHGPRAGTSLIHPHSQIIVTGMVPHYIRWREEEAQRYFDEWGRCVYCDILEYELQDQKRLILENGSFAAFIPYAAEVPFETWIMPKKHEADFGSIKDTEKVHFSFTLRDILSRLHHRLNDPDYNYIINTSARYRANEPQLHWYLQIRPRLTTPAGFEIGSGISINPSLPEEDANLLKGD